MIRQINNAILILAILFILFPQLTWAGVHQEVKNDYVTINTQIYHRNYRVWGDKVEKLCGSGGSGGCPDVDYCPNNHYCANYYYFNIECRGNEIWRLSRCLGWGSSKRCGDWVHGCCAAKVYTCDSGSGYNCYAPDKGNAWCVKKFVDIGLRVRERGANVTILCEPADELSSSLRISKGGKIYGIGLVATNDKYASGVRVKTSSGTKALRKYE
jgi:hypothetical protein